MEARTCGHAAKANKQGYKKGGKKRVLERACVITAPKFFLSDSRGITLVTSQFSREMEFSAPGQLILVCACACDTARVSYLQKD